MGLFRLILLSTHYVAQPSMAIGGPENTSFHSLQPSLHLSLSPLSIWLPLSLSFSPSILYYSSLLPPLDDSNKGRTGAPSNVSHCSARNNAVKKHPYITMLSHHPQCALTSPPLTEAWLHLARALTLDVCLSVDGRATHGL